MPLIGNCATADSVEKMRGLGTKIGRNLEYSPGLQYLDYSVRSGSVRLGWSHLD